MQNQKRDFFEQRISSFEGYIKCVDDISKPFQGKLPLGTKLLFRGQEDCSWTLLPKIARGKENENRVALLDYERNLIETAKYRLPSVFKSDLSPLDLLALLQHYGVATRLLDVTANPLVALFFACKDQKETDGEVIVFEKCIESIAPYPIQNAIADSYRFLKMCDVSLCHFYNSIVKQNYMKEQLSDFELLFKDSNDGAEWIRKCCEKIIFVQAKEQLFRQKLQQGEYILFPNKIYYSKSLEKDSFSRMIEPIPKNGEHIYSRIIIDKKSKTDILKALNIFGINKGTLFADSIDIVCEQIESDIKRMVL